jgi:8-oxo-dGTP pyrophosphatase MutT (NUDIX family)
MAEFQQPSKEHHMTTPTVPPPTEKLATSSTLRTNGAFILIRKRGGQVLVTTRKDNGKFDLPGGGVKGRFVQHGDNLPEGWVRKLHHDLYWGETPLEAACRETLTEIGFNATPTDDGSIMTTAVGGYPQMVLEKKDGEVINRHQGFCYLFLSTGKAVDMLDIDSLFLRQGEVAAAQFMTIGEIIANRDKFSLGPLRMILAHHRDFTNPNVDKDRGVYSYGALKNPVVVKIGGTEYAV